MAEVKTMNHSSAMISPSLQTGNEKRMERVNRQNEHNSSSSSSLGKYRHKTKNKNNKQNKSKTFPRTVLMMLAKQLEYYFSTTNLEKDTYLQTLRNLNDGYVPLVILANFQMVQKICPTNSDEAILKALSYSDNLVSVFVDRKTNKRVEQSTTTTLIAIGPKDSKPIVLPETTTGNSSGDESSLQNDESANNHKNTPSTIILRDVPESTTKKEVFSLFDPTICPPILNVRQEVGNCWFVTLKSCPREDLLKVMLDLRSRTLSGEPVKARLKTAMVAPTPTFPAPASKIDSYTGSKTSGHGNGKSNHHYNNTRKKNRYNPNNHNNKNNNNNEGTGGHNKDDGSSKKNEEQSAEQQPPPPLVESQFPALVKVDPFEDDDDTGLTSTKVLSDAASTATTSSSSSATPTPSVPSLKSGYAAALLKPAPPKPVTPPSKNVNNSKKANGEKDEKKDRQRQNIDKKRSKRNSKSMMDQPKQVKGGDDCPPSPKAVVIPSVWASAGGGGSGSPSFADIVRKQTEES